MINKENEMQTIYDRRKQTFLAHAEQFGDTRANWINKNRYYYQSDYDYMRFLIPAGKRVLDIGCGTGELLAALEPSHGVGIDFSPKMLQHARERHKKLSFLEGDAESAEFMASVEGPFDYIVFSDTVGSFSDCQQAFENVAHLCHEKSRLVVAYYSSGWEPALNLAVAIGQKMPQPEQNWLTTQDISNILYLAGFETLKQEYRQLIPKRLFGLGTLVNRYIAPLPLLRRLCLRNYVVARPTKEIVPFSPPTSVTVLVPCRNERGNIESAVTRTPRFCDDMEILFVEGGSSDGTWEEIQRVIAVYPQYDIKALKQDGNGKGDAVRKGFDNARGDVLMILDADLTMPPEDLPKFWNVIATGRGEFINGSRLVYPMDDDAMRFLNHLANRIFSWLFSWLLNQRYTDTLCGTKVLTREDYNSIQANRAYFGDFDPFGDFDLIFGAAKLNLAVIEVPIRYAGRSYGETQISRFRHGILLIRMVLFAFRKLKAF